MDLARRYKSKYIDLTCDKDEKAGIPRGIAIEGRVGKRKKKNVEIKEESCHLIVTWVGVRGPVGAALASRPVAVQDAGIIYCLSVISNQRPVQDFEHSS